MNDPRAKVLDLGELLTLRNQWKQQGLRVVFTNGVFDLLHPGHVLYLAEAAAEGDRLIVAINSDASVRTLNKGEHRPIQDEKARCTVISGLESVNAVVLFEDETPQKVIAALLPDVLVKGGDYSLDQIVGAREVVANGGRVKQLQFVEGYSTTAIEQKIKQNG